MARPDNPDTQKEYYTWGSYAEDIASLADKVHSIPGHPFMNVYGIPRGGLVVAVSLSHALGLPLILAHEYITPRTLVVDDIADTGTTFDALCRRLGHRPSIATLYYHPQATFKPDAYARTKEKWIVFPWEIKESSRYDGTTAA